ncbi:MAG: ROK family protein [Verrucomicrobia bacterium]|nr:ROK family protein [Verrucomicrobiota bacterium]
MSYTIGIDLGATNTKVAAFAPDGRLIAKRTRSTATGGAGVSPACVPASVSLADPLGHQDGLPHYAGDQTPPAFALGVREVIREIESAQGAPASHVGLAAPGLAARDGRSIAFMPGRFVGLEGFDWPAFLGRPAPVLNDAHAALLGEVWQGAAAGLQNVIMLTLGTGVGGAILADGRLLRGHIGRAGHLGHVCLDPNGAPDITRIPGSIEDAIGNHNIRERTSGRFATTHDLLAAYGAGDPAAAQVWLQSVRALGCAIASYVNVLDCEAVVLGGGIALAGQALFEPLQQVLDEVEWQPAGHRVRLLPAKLDDWAGAYGAAWQAMNAIPQATA